MSKLVRIRPSSEIKKTPPSIVRDYYNALASEHKRMVDFKLLLCPKCGEYKNYDKFYQSSDFITQRFPVCKDCLYNMSQQIENEYDKPNETKESVQRVLQFMNKPYDNGFYEECVKRFSEDGKTSDRKSAFTLYIASIQGLPQYKGHTWANSVFGTGGSMVALNNKKPRREIYKLFGSGFSDEEYLYLQDQYDDWKSRVEIATKPQEVYIIQICLQSLDIANARKAGKDVHKRIEALDKLMSSANLQPKQNVGNTSTDGLTFGQLIEKWELEEPIPEPDEEFKDVDGINKYLRVWFGWIAKAVGIKNVYTSEYEEDLKRYTVEKPSVDESNSSSAIYDKVFGGDKNG